MNYLPNGSATFPTLIVDRVPMEGVLGWDTSVNGNLAEQLIEPSLMGAYEGAAITVLGKGVNIPRKWRLIRSAAEQLSPHSQTADSADEAAIA